MKAIRVLLRTMDSKWVKGVATLGPIGTHLPAPGTMGSVVGILWYWALFAGVDAFSIPYFLMMILSVYGAVLICAEAEHRISRADPPSVILDEMVAVPICFIGFDNADIGFQPWFLMIAGFCLFRFFDIVKPLGIKGVQSMRAGWGIVMDDVCAAAATCLTMHVTISIIHHYHWTHPIRDWLPVLFR